MILGGLARRSSRWEMREVTSLYSSSTLSRSILARRRNGMARTASAWGSLSLNLRLRLFRAVRGSRERRMVSITASR